MPWGDKTGPRGMGPLTGRGMGICGDFDEKGFVNPKPSEDFVPFERGFGRGRGQGFGWRGR